MATFIGDFPCKIDAKCRIMLPSALVKQMSESQTSAGNFVVKKDIFEKCLVLFPQDEWERQNDLIRSKVNPYNREHNAFVREFYRGAAETSLDATNRFLIPKRLLDLVDIKSDIVLVGMDGKIEIWAKEHYDAAQYGEDDFAALAEKIMTS